MRDVFLLLFAVMVGRVYAGGNIDKFHLTPEKLTFFSDFEKDQFARIHNDSAPDYLALLLAIDTDQTSGSAINIKNGFDDLIQNLEHQGIRDKALAKETKLIFNNVHEKYLDQYVNNINFDKIFKGGKYNCLTASAFYALIFDRLGIKYAIKELPTHVFVVVDPAGEQIRVETTDPSAGYRVYSDKDKQAFVDYMRKEKLISKSEYESRSVTDLFDKYFYNESNISLKKVAGLAYFNDVLARYEAEDKQGAIAQLEKASYLYPGDKMSYYLSMMYGEMAYAEYNDKNINSVRYVARYANAKGENSIMLAEATADRLARDLIINNDLLDKYKSVFSSLLSDITDTALLRDLKERNSQNVAMHYYLKGKYYTALDVGLEAYALNPNNLSVKKTIQESVTGLIRASPDGSQPLIDSLNRAQDRYTFLKEDNMINSYILWSYLRSAGYAYSHNDAQKGSEYMEHIEALISKDKIIGPLDQAVGYGYGEASSYYVRQKNYTKARQLLNRGLEFDPQNDVLSRKLGYLKDYH